MTNAGAPNELPELRLKRGEERRIEAGHLWVFSNEVDTGQTPLAAFTPGALARVVSARDRFLGHAGVNPHALICARILSRDAARPPGRELLHSRLRNALGLRERLYPQPFYRLVFGEGDELPGLVLDRYGDVIVGQTATAAMEAMKADIVAAVAEVIAPAQFIWKNDGGARDLEGLPAYVEGADATAVPDQVLVEENGVRFRVPLAEGQKTGWFFDQAANRRAFLKYVPGRRVLDVFSYAGAWGLAAARAGAADVLCVDSSATALAATAAAAADNGLAVRTRRDDAFEALAALHSAGERFDVIVLDPPAFIKRKKQIPKGEAAYRKLNQLGLRLLARDGILVSSSCSWHLPADDLMLAIQKAARHENRFVQVLEAGGQAPDHPIHPAIPETRYLKAFFCRVL
ncbi:MAG: class I SAM-dependent rRNA methyltransferase [Gammaproteobacteria bacterium]|nr:MAG: class I SAM-dependent rRNA methyltransferase [Gammaproteobacteria bacterium]